MKKISSWCAIWIVFSCFHRISSQQEMFGRPRVQNGTATLPYPYQVALGPNPFPQPYGNQPFPGGMPLPYPYGPWPGHAPFPGYTQQYFPGYPQPVGRFSAGPGQTGMNNVQTHGAAIGKGAGDNEANIPVEILDVSPEYQRQLLGWPEEDSSSRSQGQSNRANKHRFIVNVNSHTTNSTNIPVNFTNPIITEKKYVTSIRKSFVYDPNKPENNKPINIHLINGQQVTTLPPTTTTESENVEGITSWYDETSPSTTSIKPKGRRFMDVPTSCSEGSRKAHNGACITVFLKSPKIIDETDENTSTATPALD